MSPDPLVPRGDGHTRLAADESEGLIPSYIATRGQLFEAEERNIARALLGRPPTTDRVLDDAYLRHLHGTMLGDVWEWAGRYRVRATNIGLPFEQIPEAVRSLVLDGRMWVLTGTYGSDEIAVRFHQRLVAIHPFVNGNGRHGRIVADQLIAALGGPGFSWGAEAGMSTGALRHSYLSALRSADAGDMEDLLSFARS